MSKNYVQIDPKDNIIVAITPLEKGLVTQVAGKQVVLKETIKQKHKYSLNDFDIGDEIYMYGVLIGKATLPIEEGCAITTENVKHASAEYQDSKEKDISCFYNFDNVRSGIIKICTVTKKI